ncbi:MAG TPA: hypothetical protein IAA15_09770, partial [Candidatus Olsenella pullicola]|nr:hypothetical protein [Candidatus Olsenella pullicola]
MLACDAVLTPAHRKGNGINYKYAHDYPYHIVKQDYMPDKIKGTKYY